MENQLSSLHYIPIFLVSLITSFIEAMSTITIYLFFTFLLLFIVFFFIYRQTEKRIINEILGILHSNRCFPNSQKHLPLFKISKIVTSRQILESDFFPKPLHKILDRMCSQKLICEVEVPSDSLYGDVKHYKLTEKGGNICRKLDKY